MIIVDESDLNIFNSCKWYIHSRGYAVNSYGQLLHRILLKAPKGLIVDHINGNKLDNRRINLRIGTQSDNLRNARKKRGSNKYKGVQWRPDMGKWTATITVDYKTRYLGTFLTEEEAALAYNKAALQINKEFARLNVIPQEGIVKESKNE